MVAWAAFQPLLKRNNAMLSQRLTTMIADLTRLFQSLDEEVMSFAQAQSVRCLPGCGACCQSPNIETTVAEMLPLAYELFQKGNAEDRAWNWSEQKGALCPQYESHPDRPAQGRCQTYAFRPAICRLFGYSGFRDKSGTIRFATCRKIQVQEGDKIQRIEGRLNRGESSIPFLSEAHERVAEIGGNLAWEILPINEALRRALEIIGLDARLSAFQLEFDAGDDKEIALVGALPS
jgi:Fe-S-cluster containining protein